MTYFITGLLSFITGGAVTIALLMWAADDPKPNKRY